MTYHANFVDCRREGFIAVQSVDCCLEKNDYLHLGSFDILKGAEATN